VNSTVVAGYDERHQKHDDDVNDESKAHASQAASQRLQSSVRCRRKVYGVGLLLLIVNP